MAEIRRIHTDESAAVADLWAAYASELAEPTGELSDESRTAITRHLEANATHPAATCLVACEGDYLVGFATAATFTHPTLSGVLGEIEEIYVARGHRREGIGTALATGILNWIDEHGGDVMKVRVGRGLGEPQAIAFWESMGFEADMVECSMYPAAARVR
ncbi:MAG: GNAT family N-acetyltransferase [Acidimicrobiia bacterium]|nr:GNAT family N-acetyltransferase [Acidimicrobiia bacterium]